jgi:capsular polysaccharide transport system permease protein
MSKDIAEKPDSPKQPGQSETSPDTRLLKREKKGKDRLNVVSPEQSAAIAEEKNKVIHIYRRLEEKNDRWHAQRRKMPWNLISALVCIGVPTLLASLYLFFIAADRYVADARFAIRESQPKIGGALGMLGGITSTPALADSFMVADYITSREMVRLLDQQVSIREIYSDERADFLTRLDPTVSLEGLVSYWNKRVDVLYDPLKTTIVVEVQAFTPEHAAKIATAMLENVRELVNGMSEKARRDAVNFAAQELARAEIRLRAARNDILEFRLANKDVDPMVSAQATLQIGAELEAERSQLAAQFASLSEYLADDAPSLQVLRSRMTALQSEIERIQGQVGTSTGIDGPEMEGTSGAMASSVGKYQELQTSQLLAEQAYASALTSMERARSEAERTQSYLAVYLPPKPTDDSAYPRRGRNVLVIFLLSAVFWGIGLLAAATIRDHVG